MPYCQGMARKRQSGLVVVAAVFHKQLVEKMIAVAQAEAANLHLPIMRIERVAGCYEIPLVMDRLLTLPQARAGVALGIIERGETLHGEVMGHTVANALIQIELTHRKPIGKGIVGPGATAPQARTRAVPTARGAVQAVTQTIKTLSLFPA